LSGSPDLIWRVGMVAALAALILAGCGGGGGAAKRPRVATCSSRPAKAAGERSGREVPRFGHVAMLVFENKDFGAVIGNPAMPEFNRLAERYALLTNYCAVAHPSLPNYLALVSGSTHGITRNCTDCAVDPPSLANTLAGAGRRWKTYAEGLPSPGFTGARAGRYAKKHDPLLYFKDVASDPRRRANVVPLRDLRRDLRARKLPDFSLILPDRCHDAHDCALSTADGWLSRLLRPLLASSELRRGVLFITFDEAETGDDAPGGGHVATLAVGPAVRPGARSGTRLTHYSLLRTIEDAWRLPRLGHSAGAPPIRGIWR
jgi:hypothetical protein